MQRLFIIIAFCFSSTALFSQNIPFSDESAIKQFPGLSTVYNRINNSSGLDSFYKKLSSLKKTGKGKVTILHIGDSHLQAGFFSGIIRENLQEFFGNAGRGIVFPYQLAQSNAPDDIASNSNSSWQFNRIAHPEIPMEGGVSGFGIKNSKLGATIDLSLKSSSNSSSFNKIKIFASPGSSWLLSTDSSAVPYILGDFSDTVFSNEVQLEKYSSRFSLSAMPSDNLFTFYGASLENQSAGIIYHSVGVNGARFDHYNTASLFWEQVKELKPDLVIISLGTNDAQRTSFDANGFQSNLIQFVEKLRSVFPKASTLLTTAPDSYFRRRSNAVLRQVNLSIENFSGLSRIPFWDLYKVSNGFGSAANWKRRGLMSNDGVHFTAAGYEIQGLLLFNALARGYNDFLVLNR